MSSTTTIYTNEGYENTYEVAGGFDHVVGALERHREETIKGEYQNASFVRFVGRETGRRLAINPSHVVAVAEHLDDE